MENLNQREIKPTNNLIRPEDSQCSWSMTDKEINPSPDEPDLNLQRFKTGQHEVSVVNFHGNTIEDTKRDVPFQNIDCLNEEELIDLQEDILETIDEYMNDSIQKMSNPTFHEDILEEITTLYNDYWIDSKICEEDDYEIVEEIIELMIELYFDTYKIPFRSDSYETLTENKEKNISVIKKQITYLQGIPQPKQKTQEWHDFRFNLITASNLWKALGSDSQRNSLIHEKCKPLDNNIENRFNNTEGALHWGVKYEPITLMIYEHIFNTHAADFGCIPHPQYSFIGASPDGINIDETNNLRFGRMIEIKNIFNREITGIPKEEYWIQCQIQMETCDLDECDFIETRMKEFSTEEEFYLDTTSEYKGIILYFAQRTNGYGIDISYSVPYNNAPKYVYMPIDVSLDKNTIAHLTEIQKIENPNYILFKTLYWYMDEMSCVLIKRNRRWFKSVLPKIKDTWDTILKERNEGYDHRATKKKRSVSDTNITVIKSDELSSQQIRNMPLTNSICLIKLDSVE
jgi:putative phage-type endonuclease